MNRENDRNTWLLLIALIFVLAFAFQGSRGLWEPDEGRYVRCAYEMLTTGDWITPRINFTPHFTKPPITYWLIASGLSLLGVNEWGARAFLALAFALTALLVGFFGKQLWNHRTGQAACLIYATMLLPFMAGNSVTTDTFLTLFETTAVVCFWMSITKRDKLLESSLWALAMWFTFGAAFMTKGPAGLVPLVAIFLYLRIRRKEKPLPYFVTVFGIALFLVTSLSWYWTVVRRNEGLLDYFVGHEFVGRVFTGEHKRNPGRLGAFKVYLPVLTLGALPWACYWPALLRRSRPHISDLGWWKRLCERPKALFLCLWFGISLIILSLSSSRLPLYVLPLFVPVSLATAWGMAVYLPERTSSIVRLRGKSGVAIGILAIFLVGSKAIPAHISLKNDSRTVWNGIREAILEKAGNSPYEIVLIDENYNGLAFYSRQNVEYTTVKTRKRTSPTFIPTESVANEYDELKTTRNRHIFYIRERVANSVLAELKQRGVGYSVVRVPFEHKLIFCENTPSVGRIARLAVLGDAGTGDSRQAMVGATLYHIDETTLLDGIILLGDNVVGWEGNGNPEDAYRKYFEKPYAPLLGNGAPFYAVLGNHDIQNGEGDYQTNYSLFHMGGRRYYSKIFKDDIVEVFFLDSNTFKTDSQQVSWLKQSLERSTAEWKVVAAHEPIHSTAKRHFDNPEVVKLLEPILIENRVDLVLAGHSHIYERLRPINGIQYITAGSGGKLNRGNLIPNSPERVAGNDQENVTLVFQFEPGVCHLTAYGPNGEIVDRWKKAHDQSVE